MRENWRFVSPFIFIYFALSSSVLSDDVVASNSTVRLPTSSGGDDAVKVVYLHGEKLVDGIVTSKRSIIYNLRLDVQSALDLFRVVVEVKNPKHFKHVNESFLQVYASNGAAGNFLSLPEKTGSGVVLYKNVILLMPLTPQDFRRKGEPKKKSPGVFQALNLVCSTRLHEPVEFQLLIKVLDRSQYDVKLLPDNKPKTVTLTANYVKPIAFRINTTGHYSMLVHVSSEDLICAKLLVFGDEKPLHDSLLNLKMAEKVRSLTFNKRADLYFAPGEMAVTQVINMFIYIDADDVECDPNAASRTVDKEKKIVVTFLEPSTGSGVLQMVFTVLLVMIPLPALLVGMELVHSLRKP